MKKAVFCTIFILATFMLSNQGNAEEYDHFIRGAVCVPKGLSFPDPAWEGNGNVRVSIPSEDLKKIVPEFDYSIARVEESEKEKRNYGPDSMEEVDLTIIGTDYQKYYENELEELWEHYISKKSAISPAENVEQVGYRVYDELYHDTWVIVEKSAISKEKTENWFVAYCNKANKYRIEANRCEFQFQDDGIYYGVSILEKNLKYKNRVTHGILELLKNWKKSCDNG